MKEPFSNEEFQYNKLLLIQIKNIEELTGTLSKGWEIRKLQAEAKVLEYRLYRAKKKLEEFKAKAKADQIEEILKLL